MSTYDPSDRDPYDYDPYSYDPPREEARSIPDYDYDDQSSDSYDDTKWDRFNY